jgi:hypothetical protein
VSLRTIDIALKAKAAAFRAEHNGRAILAYNIAALSRAKRLPKIETLFARERKPKQTWQESYALMQKWYRAQQIRKRLMGEA